MADQLRTLWVTDTNRVMLFMIRPFSVDSEFYMTFIGPLQFVNDDGSKGCREVGTS